MAKRKLTPAQRAVALRNLKKARKARKAKAPKRAAPKKKRARLTNRARKALGYHKERKTMATKKKGKKKGGGRRRGGGRGLMSGIEFMDMAGAGAYGWLEKQATTAGDEAYIKKVPLFFEGIGYAGCSAILAHVISKNVGGALGKAARHYAKGVFDVAAYKLIPKMAKYTIRTPKFKI